MKKIQMLAFIFIVSCSTNWKSFMSKDSDTKKRNENLMKDFKVDKGVLDKFETKDTKVKHVESKKTESAVSPSRKSERLKEKERVKKKTATADPLTQITNYPSDYPKEYIELNKNMKKMFKNFSPVLFDKEKLFMDINYLGVSTGKIVISTKPMTMISGTKAYHFNARLQTSRFYSYLYELDDQVDTFVDSNSFVPLKFSLIQRESGKDVDDLQLFDHQKLKGFNFYKRIKDKKVKKRQGEFYIPQYFQDPLSLVYFIRGLNFEKQNEYLIPFLNKGELKTFKVTLLGSEKVNTNIGEKLAYKIRGSSDYNGSTIKSGDMTFWFSKDNERIFLKFEAKIKIGSVSGEIEKFER